MTKKSNKFISPGAWFSLFYPSDWNEFEDGEGSFLFYNPDSWTGNFRVSAFKAEAKLPNAMVYGKQSVTQELKDNSSASLVNVGSLECAYYKQMFQEEGTYYTTHFWVTGIDNIAFECSFTVPRGGETKEAEDIITSLAVRQDGVKYPAELIPIRLSEIYQVNEGYDWAASTVKKLLKKDFQGVEEDLPKLQQAMDSGGFSQSQRDAWVSFGITICTILYNEVDGVEWRTLIDGNREIPVLQYRETDTIIDPMQLVWSRVKAGKHCDAAEEYENIMQKIGR
ncbi:DUF3805 domain-containing protein [uncultured Bacteroides sp.]|uniref:DUF3805 domain-containing protein n=1 Tax=uncultured Bacteroides sp. TaxID=162156 RepID=UPI002AA84EE1|nr:DUF3805 domain-containing protein [uncultured Bacteroides sp.]